jgi:hypothetical protein
MGYAGLPPVADQVTAELLKLGMIFLCSNHYTPSFAWGKGKCSQPVTTTLPSGKPLREPGFTVLKSGLDSAIHNLC